jgi:hypothetical protein
MRLKNTSYRTQTKKLNLQLRQKVETGDVLQAIDYEQLSIENSQYQASLDEKNKEMLSLKTLAGRTIHSLNQCKVCISAAIIDKVSIFTFKGT